MEIVEREFEEFLTRVCNRDEIEPRCKIYMIFVFLFNLNNLNYKKKNAHNRKQIITYEMKSSHELLSELR